MKEQVKSNMRKQKLMVGFQADSGQQGRVQASYSQSLFYKYLHIWLSNYGTKYQLLKKNRCHDSIEIGLGPPLSWKWPSEKGLEVIQIGPRPMKSRSARPPTSIYFYGHFGNRSRASDFSRVEKTALAQEEEEKRLLKDFATRTRVRLSISDGNWNR